MSDDEPVDKYGNPTSGERLIYCCFPDCGCDGARLCMAERGCSVDASKNNVEGMWSNGSDPKCARAVFNLVGRTSQKSSLDKSE